MMWNIPFMTELRGMFVSEKISDLKRKRIRIAASDKHYDYCTLCWCKTKVAKHTPIELRSHYIEGVGQLPYVLA